MNADSTCHSIQKLLEATLDSDDIEEITDPLGEIPAGDLATAFHIGLILSDFSIKAAAEYFRVLPEVLKSLSPDELGGWVAMGIPIAKKSSGAGIRFFKEGPRVFSQIPSRAMRERFIRQGNTLAQKDYNLAVEYYRQAPPLLSNSALSDVAFSAWAMQGLSLGENDYTLAVEYYRITPTLLRHLPMRLIPKWIAVGLNLAQGNLLQTLLFMRNSPEIFSKIPSSSEQAQVLELTHEVAEQSLDLAGQLFKDALEVLPPFRILHLESILLEKAIEIARFNGELAATLFLSGPRILKEMGPVSHKFSEWVETGIALLKTNPDAAQGFFSLKSKSALHAIDQLKGGVSLSRISRTLKIYAEALSGQRVSIAATTRLEEDGAKREADLPTTDGKTIYLPAHVGHFPTDALNFEWYKVATAYQAGYLEYGTFFPQMNETADLIASLQEKYQRRGGFSSLSSFFSLFPEPALIKKLFEISEGSRIEFKLKQEYPGLKKAIIRMREADLEQRPSLMGLTPRGMVLEFLLQISLAGKTKEPIPPPLQKILFEACRILGAVQTPEATVATSMKAATAVFDHLEEGEGVQEMPTGPMETFEEEGRRAKGEGEESGEIRPSTRGAIEPERVEETRKVLKKYSDALLEKLKEAGVDVSSESAESALSISVDQGEVSIQALRQGKAEEDLDRIADRLGADQPGKGGDPKKKTFLYDEWNCEVEDYRPGWCRVIENRVSPANATLVDAIVAEYGGMIHAVRTAFLYLRPEGLKRVKKEREGDALDLDALMESRIDARSGRTPSDRIYVARYKKERSVAVAVLVDMSGSTQQQLPQVNKSILQIEKEALIILARAIDAVGDRFALYGFSGKGKDTVDFNILKDFEESYNRDIDCRIGGIQPAIQNRDGAAIRHATIKLAAQPVKIKILVLISDGKPLDDDYRGSYAMADTRVALREAKRQGIHPYCITVDRDGDEYLKGMYGDVAYMVIDHVEKLPARLPYIYKRLTT
ncbi:MAG: VWA domain-containing protein [Nitrospira sp.]|nr:VWA domain-containing protein [Candidatus Manganitrophaceae bacterium]HIL34070.1 VWA domain-containing protein [Candidatus Manganitrophaceae bacterium]